MKPFDETKGWKHQYYDSYRPATQREALTENRSPTIAKESKTFRHHCDQRLHQAEHSSKTNPQGNLSSPAKSSGSQSEDLNSLATPILNRNSPSTSHDPERRDRMPPREIRDRSRPNIAPPLCSSLNEKNESEAQKRGFYGSFSSPITRINGHELAAKRPREDESTDRSSKRRRDEKYEHNHHHPERDAPKIAPTRDPRIKRSLTLTLPVHYPEQVPTCKEDHLVLVSATNEHSADYSVGYIDAHMESLDEEERIKRKQHEKELAEDKSRKVQELHHGLEEKKNQKRHDAEMARKAAFKKQDEEHEILMAELRRR